MCEDYPCCGHEQGDCPDAQGRFTCASNKHKRMTRAQVIRQIERAGWVIEFKPRRSTLWMTSPTGHRGYFDLRDLLAEIQEGAPVYFSGGVPYSQERKPT